MTKVYLSLSSNQGKREHFLRDALEILAKHPAITVTQVSPIYETEPWGMTNQPWFLNQVVEIETELKPERLLILCSSIEQKLGRVRREPWDPREIDIDILLYGDQIINTVGLRIPQLHLNERRFNLEPLLDIAPRLVDPITGRPFRELLQELPEGPRVRPLN